MRHSVRVRTRLVRSFGRMVIAASLFGLAGGPVAAQSDRDGDGVADDGDNCPDVANRDQRDGDHDRAGDACDNCPALFNPDQDDGDGDRIGDGCADTDADGVEDGEDLCPFTPPGVGRLGLGCSAGDLVRPSRMIDALRRVIDAASATVGNDPGMSRVGAKLGKATTKLRPVETALKEGKTCQGARMVRGICRRIASATTQLMRITHKEEPLPVVSPGDVRSEELERQALDEAQRALDDAGAAVNAVHAVLESACTALGDKVKLTATVDDIDVAAGRITLGDGTMWALPLKRFGSGFGVGREVKLHVRAYTGGGGIVQAAKPGKSGPSHVTTSCIKLRVAPVQRFAPVSSGPYTLHPLDGYVGNLPNIGDLLLLERDMRLAAQEVACFDPIPEGYSSVRHSLAITTDCHGFSLEHLLATAVNNTPPQTLAAALTPEDGPIGLPCCDSGTLTITEHRQQCRALATGKTICDPVEEVGDALDLTFLIQPRNTYCTAHYEQDAFEREDDNPNPAVARVTALALDATVPPVALPDAFHAEGYAIVPFILPVSSYPVALDIATVASPYERGAFSIYNQFLDRDFYKESAATGFVAAFQALSALQHTGVDRPSGLRWPHVAGTRNGAEFWYSCALPHITRDVISPCSALQYTLYRWPFHDDSLDLPTSGVCGFPNLGHCGYFDPVDPTCTMCQRYAYDVGRDLGTPIYAARGGLVITAVGDQVNNAWNCCSAELGVKQCNDPDIYTDCVEGEPFCTCFCGDDPPVLLGGQMRGCTIGNYLHLRHSDGSIGIYFHMQSSAAGAAVEVAVGDRVARGQLLGHVGNTGNSSDPHLHFEEVSSLAALDTLMRFQVMIGSCMGTCNACNNEFDCGGAPCVCNPNCDNTLRNCFIPAGGDTLCTL